MEKCLITPRATLMVIQQLKKELLQQTPAEHNTKKTVPAEGGKKLVSPLQSNNRDICKLQLNYTSVSELHYNLCHNQNPILALITELGVLATLNRVCSFFLFCTK